MASKIISELPAKLEEIDFPKQVGGVRTSLPHGRFCGCKKNEKGLGDFQFFDYAGVPLPFAILIIGVASLCFSNSYDGQFVFDDTVAIVNNADVKDTSLLNLFVNDFWGTKLSHKQSHRSYRPLTILTFRFHYWLRGYLDPMDFHIANIVLHTIVCILTLFVFNILQDGKANGIAFCAALLFAVHPCHAEAVSGIVGRADVLCAFFAWLSLISYSRCIYSRRRYFKISSMALCIICITASMLCKEIGITTIGICGIYDIIIVNKVYPISILELLRLRFTWSDVKNFFNERSTMIKRLSALSLTGVILVLLRFSIMGFSMPTFQPVDNPASFVDNFFYRIINYNYIYCLNLWLLICPEWLCFDWSMGCIPLISGYDRRLIAVFGLWIFIGTFIVLSFNARRRKNLRHVGMGLSLLIIPFLPASNILFNVGFVLAERTLYLPSAGYCLLTAIGLQILVVRFARSRVTLFLYMALIALYFTRSWIRSDQWRFEKSLFQSALGVCSLNAKVHYNIAKNAADLGNLTLAEAEYREALRLNPDYAQAMNNLGNLMKERGNYEEAEKLLKHALELQEDFATAWMNLGIVLSALKKYNESEKSYEKALSHRPVCPDCYYNLGVSFLEIKENDKALKAWQNAIAQKANHRRAWVNWVRLLDDMGKPNEALKVARTALKFVPGDPTIHFNIANILGKAGQFEEAEVEFKEAISKDPTNPTILTNLGVLYHRWNKFEEAELLYKNALTIKPDLQSAKDNLRKLITRSRMKRKMINT